MVAVTCFTATNMNDPIGPALVGAVLSDFSNESLSSFTFTANPDQFVVSSSFSDFLYLISIPISGTITDIAKSVSNVEQFDVSGLDITIGSVISTAGTVLATSAILAGDDNIVGSPFADQLIGATGNDTINGGAGNDSIDGGPGTDDLTGGPGADHFVFSATTDSAVGPARDMIADFHHSQHDKIDLHLIDADQRASHPGNQAFVFIGTDTFAHYHSLHHHVVGMVRFNPHTHVVQGNVNTSLAPDFEIAVPHVVALVAGDFIL
jgi:hypothetical protein